MMYGKAVKKNSKLNYFYIGERTTYQEITDWVKTVDESFAERENFVELEPDTFIIVTDAGTFKALDRQSFEKLYDFI